MVLQDVALVVSSLSGQHGMDSPLSVSSIAMAISSGHGDADSIASAATCRGIRMLSSNTTSSVYRVMFLF